MGDRIVDGFVLTMVAVGALIVGAVWAVLMIPRALAVLFGVASPRPPDHGAQAAFERWTGDGWWN